MKKRFAKIGVFHHDCWYTKAINRFDININEISLRTNKLVNGQNSVTGTFKLVSPKQQQSKFFESLRRDKSVTNVKRLSNTFHPMFSVTWKTPSTVYDRILEADCPFVSPVYSRNGLETFEIISNDFKQMRKILSESEDVGQVKIFYLGNRLNENELGLTSAQTDALLFALSKGYYEWPKKANLEKLSTELGKKRRTFQENLRRAEAKIIPQVVRLLK